MRTFFSLLLSFIIVAASAQETQKQNASSLFSGARITKSPASYTTTSSTGMVTGYSPEAIIDGSQNKVWCSAKNKKPPFVFEIELVETYKISEFELNNLVENYAGIGAKDIVIELAASKKSPVYTTVLKESLKEKDISRFSIAPTEARMIRLTINSNYGNSEYTELAEFNALGETKFADVNLIDVDGLWNSNWGNLTFRQNGTLVDGNYVFNKGKIRFGGIQRNKVTYTWVEDVINRKGNTLMFMNEEGDELIGIWCYDNDWANYGFWILNRKKSKPLLPININPETKDAAPQTVQNIKTEPGIVTAMETELKANKKLVVYGINFKFNSSEILPESHNVLRQIYEVLNKNENMKIRVEGHTDNSGSDAYNNSLSLQRAESVKKFFEISGIDQSRIIPEGKGESTPVADNESEMGRSLNRRVEIHLVGQ